MVCNRCHKDTLDFCKGQRRCRSCSREANRISYLKNIEKYKEKRSKIDWTLHYSKYKNHYNTKSANYYHKKKKALPKWLSEDFEFFISEIYILARKRSEITGIKWEVDHIIPIAGKTVCGLHVPWNLQVIPWKINRSKSNKF